MAAFGLEVLKILLSFYLMFILFIVVVYLYAGIESFGREHQEKGKENPDKELLAYFSISTVLHFGTALALLVQLAIAFVEAH